MDEDAPTTWEEMRSYLLQNPSYAAMFTDIGLFIGEFSIAELFLSRLLMVTSRVRDPVMFDVLCRGLDARGKVERLIKAAKRHGGIGPNFQKRLHFFEKRIVPIRNTIAHSSMYPSEKQSACYLAFGLANPPFEDWGMEGGALYRSDHETITSERLAASAYWLADFASDVSDVEPRAARLGMLEIDRPRSPLPPEENPHLDPRVDLATYRRLQEMQHGGPVPPRE